MLELVFEEGDIEEALHSLDRRDRLEKAVLLLLKKQPHGYFNAYQNISRNTRLIYVHGYQSYVWNRAVSERFRRFGRQVLVGDLVIKRENADLLENVEIDEVEAPVAEPEEETKEESKEATAFKQRRDVNPVIDVTEENIGEFTIHDVVMPMVGSSIRLPKNAELAAIFNELLSKDGLTMQNFAQMS